MLLVLGIIQIMIIAINCVLELRRKSSAVFLWAVLLIMFGIPHLLSIFSNSYRYSIKTMQEASVFVILFSIIYLITRLIIYRNKNHLNKEEKLNLNEEEYKLMHKFMLFLFIFMIVLVLVRIIVMMKSAGGILNVSWETMRETSKGGYFSFSQIFITLFFATSSCIILAIKLNNRKIVIFSILVVLIEVLISKNRIEILPIFVSIIYIYIIEHKISLKQLICLGMIGIIAIYMIYALRAFRHIGTLDNLIKNYNIRTFNEKVFLYLENDDGELSLRENMYYFIENNNNFYNFSKGHTYIRMILVFVPTSWSMGMKPDDFAITMGKAILPLSQGYSVHPTLFGDVYANFGFYGIVMGIFWAFFVSIIDKIIEGQNKILYLPYILNFRYSLYY